MPDESFGDKSEAPTPRRLEEARERGQVPRSSDLTASLVLLAAMGALAFTGDSLARAMLAAVEGLLSFGHAPALGVAGILAEAATVTRQLAFALAPVLGAVAFAGILANLIQSGPVFSATPLRPSLEKLDPLKGFGRIFSKRSLVRFVMNLGKLGAISWISYAVIAGDFERIVALSGMGVSQMAAGGAELVVGLGLKLAAVFVVLAVLDLLYQKWQFLEDLKMTKQEVREEMKRMEGDPMIREQRRHIQRQMAMHRMAHDVPKADAVITNPTHFAIAIRYDADTMAAPKVVAKGADHMARRIREIAMEHGVPIVEKPSLARALYRVVEVGQEIPIEFYRAVAEVLAFVYRISNRRFNPTAA